MTLLVVDDDRKLAASLQRGLQAEGLIVDLAHDGLMGRAMALDGTYEVVVLDLMLPGRNGYQVCADLRAEGDWTPILMLTAKDGEYDEAEGLDTGADDYLTKPFSFTVLLARINALMRRSGARSPIPLQVGCLTILPAAHRVMVGDREVEVTAREFDVLAYLARRPGQVLNKQQILDAVWDQAYDGDDNIVEVYISRLRRKLGDTDLLQTVRGVGYRLTSDGAG
ncbi:MAG: response regulator transcription factor [Euzebya sp.]